MEQFQISEWHANLLRKFFEKSEKRVDVMKFYAYVWVRILVSALIDFSCVSLS